MKPVDYAAVAAKAKREHKLALADAQAKGPSDLQSARDALAKLSANWKKKTLIGGLNGKERMKRMTGKL